jgi:formate-dependent nitrite reductase membrane component NrfD
MQACPYDAIYLDPERNTAAKCHYCAHRTQLLLEPACVSACPEHAIIAGDLDDPESEVAYLLAREPVRVRKPEQATRPKLFYIDADESSIVPTAARHEPFYMWSERNHLVAGGGAIYSPNSPYLQPDALAAYDVSHRRPWDWLVPLYCWSKSIAGGVLAVPAVAVALKWLPRDRLRDIALSSIALIFIAVTLVALIGDLARKERFFYILRFPQLRSWLSLGSFILMAYTLLCGPLWVSELANYSSVSGLLLWPAVGSGFLAVVYTASLFGQCEGRDLWQTPLLPLHLLVQSLISSAAVLALLPIAWGGGTPQSNAVAAGSLSVFMVLHLLLVAGELTMPHASDNASYAARLIVGGPFRNWFWAGAVGLGVLLPLALLFVAPSSFNAVAIAAVLALAGLFVFEWCFVMAGQSVPNS